MHGERIKAAFLDRDGTIVSEKRRIYTAEDMARAPFLEGCIEALLRIQAEGYQFFIVTNQSAVGAGLISVQELQRIHGVLLDRLGREGIHWPIVYYCPHLPESGCECRKPRPGMLLQAARQWNIDLAASILIGNSPADARAAQNAGVRAWWMLEHWSAFDIARARD